MFLWYPVLDLARAPRRAARKKGSGYENGQYKDRAKDWVEWTLEKPPRVKNRVLPSAAITFPLAYSYTGCIKKNCTDLKLLLNSQNSY